MDIKEIPYCELVTNLITRSLVYLEEKIPTTGELKAYLVTRNQHILDIFETYDYPFKHIDLSTKQIHVVDVKTGNPCVINLEITQNVQSPGDPNLLSPPVIGNPLYADIYTDKDIADIQLPFCMAIKKLKSAGCYGDVTVPKNILDKALYFRDISKACNITLPEEIDFYLSNNVQIMCNKILHEYMCPKKFDLLTARYILTACKEEIESIPLDTYEDVEKFINDADSMIAVWGGFLQRLVNEQIEMFNMEYETIVTQQLQNMEQREKDFIRLQYNRAITDLQQLDIQKNLRKFGNNTLIMLRYFPRELRVPENLNRFSIFSSYENAILEAIIKNGVEVSQADFIFDYVDFISTNFTTIDFLTQINASYLDKMKERRLEQIKKCSAEIVEMIKQDTEGLDEEDIQDIISSMQDFEAFEEKLNGYNDIGSVIQYWPSVLLPAPDYVTRLAGVTQNFIDVQML